MTPGDGESKLSGACGTDINVLGRGVDTDRGVVVVGICMVIELVVLMPMITLLRTSSYVDALNSAFISDLISGCGLIDFAPTPSVFMRFKIICVAALNCGIYRDPDDEDGIDAEVADVEGPATEPELGCDGPFDAAGGTALLFCPMP